MQNKKNQGQNKGNVKPQPKREHAKGRSQHRGKKFESQLTKGRNQIDEPSKKSKPEGKKPLKPVPISDRRFKTSKLAPTPDTEKSYPKKGYRATKQEDNYQTPARARTTPRKSISRKVKPHPEQVLIRLNKYIANAGICSRRDADKFIEVGAVKINNVIVTELGTKVGPGDIVHLGEQTVKAEKPRYVLLNKAKNCITTSDDPYKRNTVMHLVADACRERIYPVGRLDRNTTGLLLLTNDGDLTRRLTHPRFGVSKVYDVELDKPLQKSDFEDISKGVNLDGEVIQVDEIAYIEFDQNKKHIGIELHSGQNRVVRRIFEKYGYKVVKLDRVMFGPLTKKNLPRGRWRHLTDLEISTLKRL